MPLPLVASCCHDNGKGLLPACFLHKQSPHTVKVALNKLHSSRALQTPGSRFSPPCECVPLLSIHMMECPFQAAVRTFTNPKRGMDVSHSATPGPSPCPGREGSNGDVILAVLLVTVAGVAVLLLLYRLLQLRHRLKMARARHALEYYGFYHSATYRLPHVPLYEDEAKTGTKTCPGPGPALVHTVTPLTPPTLVVTSLPPVPPPPMTCPPPEQAPPLYQTTPFEEATPLIIPPLVVPSTPSLLLPPVRHVTPPSPHLSWGACSDVELYSRIGAYRSSRLSSLSSQSRVILFEHSSL
ncbi:uncharacterized protein LOC110159941 [Boleophthalmus pectinirostris]|uniref:uncharacterized protein LOC110159941 n=1 Tax=Boleophthalmus pectinirostris TaxID=150288 RepID=UPI00242D87E2|nr:uncharacterized protein LOC110159941 [Boleophthalmus pectinirostris]XP_055009812.1 uncharacterized protein LOC110159941 [Boleophthalmus pectinirostris]